MRNRYLLFLDLPLIWVAALAAFVLRFDLRFGAYQQEFLFFVAAASILKPAAFFFAGVYGRYWRYASVTDLIALLAAATAASAALVLSLVAGLTMGLLPSFSRSVVVIDWLLTLILVGALRGSVRVLAESDLTGKRVDHPRRPVLIAGAGQAGVIVSRDLQRNPQLGMVPVGFLDDDPDKLGKRIAGLMVLGRLDELAHVARSREIGLVVIAMPTAPGSVVRTLAEACRQLSLKSMVIPGVFELVGGTVTIGRLRSVQITDLLRRSHAQPAFNAQSYVAGRTVLISGAGGSIGQEICRQVANLRPKLIIMLGHGENSLFEARAQLLHDYPDLAVLCFVADVRNAQRLQRLFGALMPEIVFHAAAHKHVPLMEENPEEAITNNAIGTRNMLQAALAAGTERFVLISTDKAAAPYSVMGASKRLAEELVRQTAARFGRGFMVVRFGNVLGSRGSAVPIFQRQIERGGPITITHRDMKRYFMTIPEAAHLVLEAAALGKGGELFVLRMGEPVAIVELAEDMIRLSGAQDIPIIFTGTRSGEKLEEILWEPDARTEPTAHPDILSVHEPGLSPDIDWGAAIEHLAAIAAKGHRQELVAEMARYLPTFARAEPGPAAIV